MEMANEKNVQVLAVGEYNDDLMDYRHSIEVTEKSDAIFTQIKLLFNTLGISDSFMKMSKKSWKLKVNHERILGNDEEEESEESKAEEGEEGKDSVPSEPIFMKLEVLKRDGKKYLFAKRTGGSFKYYQHLWD